MAKQYQLPFQLDDPTLLHFDSFINNEWVTAADGSRFEVSDPGTSLPWASCPNNSAADVPKAVESSHAAFEQFKKVNPRIRAQLLMKWDGLIRDARSDLAKILTHETGKPIAEAYGEIDYALGFTWWFAGEAERIQGGIAVPSAANRRVFTIKQPIGVAAALIPWNFPIAMALRKAAAAFAAGCTMIVKPSPETPITTLACITANRIYVQSGVYEKFAQLLKERTSALVVGHGAKADTTMGPVTTPRSLDKAEGQVEDAVKLGGKVILGGGRKKDCGGGYFFEPTIIMDMKADMLISREETFAPIAALYKFETEEEAVKWANDTSMGLASYAFTKDVDRTWRMLENLEAGMIGLNTGNASAAESPFGGIKESGYGKESGKDVAVAEYLITKTGTFTLEGQY
ncbi:succinate-semialdehyde dehydrogenase [Blastomyces silverae]|uniref:Succinate-semialdehyde dehydrogenase n=1 Tax=Blastomyces silverae TaxID=2060906 RepID=A0A0H1BMW3_9EURO|nr:succinate-semialdehyde dehydrogenase [Blastomyces silverae]